jgi:hypothetical protein
MSLQELEISERIHIMETYYDLNALLEDRIDNQSNFEEARSYILLLLHASSPHETLAQIYF